MTDRMDAIALHDLIIIGAGPAGLQAALTAQELGLSYRVIDRRGLAHSFVEYPQNLRFFSPPDEMTVGGIPFPMRGGDKPTREDILPYFRAVADYKKLELSLWEEIIEIRREGEFYELLTLLQPNHEETRHYRARAVLLASGVWDKPNGLLCSGGDLPHVFTRFHEPTEFYGMPVLVAGGGNSAATAAMMLAEAHAQVTLVMRREPVAYQSGLRPFVLRDLNFFVEEGKINLITNVRVSCVEPQRVWLEPFAYDETHEESGTSHGEAYPVSARFVFALTGQRGDSTFLERIGMCVRRDGRPENNPETFETNLPNLFVAGSLADKKIDIVLTSREQTARTVQFIAERLRK